MMKARRGRSLTVQAVFDRLAFGGVDWPLKTVRLERDSLEDFNQRMVTPRVCLAEVYHENSKLFRGMLEDLAATRTDADGVRREFLRRRREWAADLPRADADPPVGHLLRAITDACAPELFYAVELRVFDGQRILFHEPLSSLSYVLKDLGAEERLQLRAAVEVPGLEPPPGAGPFLLLVGSLARNDLLYGARGYRRTLLEAGRVTQAAVRAASQGGMAVRVRCEFIDRAVDAVLESDGTEESTLVIIDVEGPHAG